MSLRYLTAGESHGPGLTAILEGLPAGLDLDESIINKELARRQQGYGAGPRMKIETDQAKILGGVMEGKTTGAPLSIWIENKDHEKWKNKKIESTYIPRPGHADLTGLVKYGYNDIRPTIERSSARETAARVAIGAVCKHLLAQFGIIVGGYVAAIAGIEANLSGISVKDRLARVEESEIRCPDPAAEEKIIQRIEEAIKNKNTLGGVIEVYALNLPVGLGSHVQWDRKLEARLGAAVLGTQAMKGVEIGRAFENSTKPGTQAQDEIYLRDSDQSLVRKTNRAGGLEGGMTNGEPLLIRAAMKPIATTLTPQKTVNLITGEEVPTRYERSDFCPTPRAVVVLENAVSVVLADALMEKIGGDSMNEMLPRFASLRKASLNDISLDDEGHQWW
ncbi:MAG: chorismate synthase [Anaerolineales bacterium]|nr:chorismate synthase [Anaerolineales bacterium]